MIEIFTIHELEERTEMSRRSIRYYIQRGLLDPPQGSGRGSHYLQEHLDRLFAIRQLQEAGVRLESIRARLSSPAHKRVAAEPSQWTRMQLTADIEIHARTGSLSAAQMEQIAQAVQDIAGSADSPNKEERKTNE